jgi:hypothetical protein
LYQSGILEQAQGLLPNKVIEIVLAQGSVLADRAVQVPPAIGADATVVVENAMWVPKTQFAQQPDLELAGERERIESCDPPVFLVIRQRFYR